MNSRKERVLAIVPTWRERQKICKVIRKFKKGTVDEICIVMDEPWMNAENTIRAAGKGSEIPIHVISNPKRRGVGYALREGMEYALNKGYDIIVVLAGNEKDNPAEIPMLVRPLVDGSFDYIQGSRFLPQGKHVNTPILRWIFNRVWPLIWTVITDRRCTDVTNGFRAYRTSLLKDRHVNLNQSWLRGYSLEYYMHYKALTLGYRTQEVPVSKVYSHRHKGGYSKISPFRDWWQIIGPPILLKLGVRR